MHGIQGLIWRNGDAPLASSLSIRHFEWVWQPQLMFMPSVLCHLCRECSVQSFRAFCQTSWCITVSSVVVLLSNLLLPSVENEHCGISPGAISRLTARIHYSTFWLCGTATQQRTDPKSVHSMKCSDSRLRPARRKRSLITSPQTQRLSANVPFPSSGNSALPSRKYGITSKQRKIHAKTRTDQLRGIFI